MIPNKTIDTLRDLGLRLTRPRRIILDVVRATDAHPTAAFVYRRVRRRLPRVSLATVYRNLRMLAAEGFLAERADEAGMRFDGNTGPHDHFTCLTCGRIYDVPAPAPRGARRRRGPRSPDRVLRPLRRVPPAARRIIPHPTKEEAWQASRALRASRTSK